MAASGFEPKLYNSYGSTSPAEGAKTEIKWKELSPLKFSPRLWNFPHILIFGKIPGSSVYFILSYIHNPFKCRAFRVMWEKYAV